jgi:nucleotide-binding universal stress UspA family protein
MGEITQGKFPIVVGVDFSEASAYAIQEAAQLARFVRNIELNFVHVVAAPADLHDARVIDALSERLNRTMSKFEHFVRDVLFVFGAPLADGHELAFHMRVGVPAHEIHQVAVDSDAEMIIVGKDEPPSLWRLFHRTTVDGLLRMAHVPVVVARQKDFRGLERTASPEPARPGQERLECGITTYSYSDFNASRAPHVSGMI